MARWRDERIEKSLQQAAVTILSDAVKQQAIQAVEPAKGFAFSESPTLAPVSFKPVSPAMAVPQAAVGPVASPVTVVAAVPQVQPIAAHEPARANLPQQAPLKSEWSVVANLGSHHILRPGGRTGYREDAALHPYNEVNLGGGITYKREFWKNNSGLSAAWTASGGAYSNSLRDISLYAMGGLEVMQELGSGFKAGAGVEGGLISGYTKQVAPGGQVYAKIEKELSPDIRSMIGGATSVYAKFGLNPPARKQAPIVITGQVGITF